MTSREIRQSFLDFFASKQHTIVPSAPVVPHGDPTLLFTNAGMNQFKDVFLGTGTRDYSRAADTQKCIRVSGKHNDLEEVGYDTYHHTFFEMLGNWSFGDYYKREAIDWAWELLTEVWKLDTTRLHATVYRTDDEAFALWERYLPKERIHHFDEKDNFWEMGESGPCGPCSEIHYDRTPDKSGGPLVNTGVPEVIEIWNLVFIQYNRKADGSLEDLPAKHVDTGMGFERICAVIQGKGSNYDADVFTPVISAIETLSGRKYSGELDHKDGIAMRVMADHVRTVAFSVADGAFPGNEGRGYVLRRILRRAVRYSRNLGFREPVIFKLVQVLADTMGDVFPELKAQQSVVERVIKAEEENFLQTLERGLDKFDEIAAAKSSESSSQAASEVGSKAVSGADAFLLYDTFGFPLDLTELIARERGMTVDADGFHANMNAQRERSRKARKTHLQEAEAPPIQEATRFVGYGGRNELTTEAKVLYVKGNQVVLDQTPFYAEMGGQASDTGTITMGGNRYVVVAVQKVGAAFVHFCETDVEALVGDTALASVDTSRRQAIAANHSATHILHEALRRVLGSHVQQAGSVVTPDGLHFDFPHFQKLTSEELRAIEDMVNAKIRENISIQTRELPIEEARAVPGVKSFFGDKYGATVRVVTIDEKFSAEFCGGTHTSNTSEIGLFMFTGESSIAAGTRRVEATTGAGIETVIRGLEQKVQDERTRAEAFQQRIKQLEKEVAALQLGSLAGSVAAFVERASSVQTSKGAVRVIAEQVETADLDQLKALGDEVRNALGKAGVGLLASIVDDKVQLVCIATDDVKDALHAGKLVGEVAKTLGGGGGGKPHLASAGGKDVAKLGETLSGFAGLVAKM